MSSYQPERLRWVLVEQQFVLYLQEYAQASTVIGTNYFYPFLTKFPTLTKLQVEKTSREIFIPTEKSIRHFHVKYQIPFSYQIQQNFPDR